MVGGGEGGASVRSQQGLGLTLCSWSEVWTSQQRRWGGGQLALQKFCLELIDQ